MIRLKIILASLFLGYLSLFAQTEVVQAAENIKFLSQKIAGDYLLHYSEPENSIYRKNLEKNILQLEKDFREIAKSTHNEDIKNILDYLSYNKDELKNIIAGTTTSEHVQKLLDDSEALVEGADSILQTLHKQTLHGELKFHIMKLFKHYMAIHLKFDPTQNTKVLYTERKTIDTLTRKKSQNLYNIWQNYKTLYDPSLLYFLPHITTIATDDLIGSIAP